jgi:tetratricopeptide (TPR) repeat protein
MASLIPGYEYDIFISYRQKDNKYDGWVTEFVDNLRKELEATFKEEITVYFDINPHDGLLETHDVDASLKEKLKCLVFIPIISRTYCDPKSFAWEHEFRAFIEEASKDQFGLKVRVPSGNVANRVLPVRIHDLEVSDIKECELLLDGVLRGIEFIYKETGVNRSLTPKDNERKNLNATIYRNQINKATLAIKEIFQGLLSESGKVFKETPPHRETLEEVDIEVRKEVHSESIQIAKQKLPTQESVLRKTKSIFGVAFKYPKIFKRDKLEKFRSSSERISVAVMPFQNMTNDTTWNDWQDGIKDELINYLTNYRDELDIKQAGSIDGILQSKGLTNYSSLTTALASSISNDLNAMFFIFGSIKKAGDKIRVNARLIDSKTEEILKPFQLEYPANVDKIFSLIDSLSGMIKDFLIISKIEKEGPYEFEYYSSTNSPEAYQYYRLGNNAFAMGDLPAACDWYLRAIEKDTNFAAAINMLSITYFNLGLYELGKENCLRNYRKREHLSVRLQLYVNYFYAMYFQTPEEEIKYFRQVLDYDNQSPADHAILGFSYIKIYQFDKAISEIEKAFEIYKKWGSKTIGNYNYTLLGLAYHNTGKYKEEQELYKNAERVFPNDRDVVRRQAILSVSQGDTLSAKKYIEKYITILKDNSASEVLIEENLAGIFSEAGILNKAEEYYINALSLEPKNPWQINNLAYFLIDKNRDLNKGLLLADKALELSPDDYIYLHTKGWGLFKQGNFDEALRILKKSWDLRMEKAVYNHDAFLHLEAAKKAVAGLKSN